MSYLVGTYGPMVVALCYLAIIAGEIVARYRAWSWARYCAAEKADAASKATARSFYLARKREVEKMAREASIAALPNLAPVCREQTARGYKRS